MPRYLCNNGLLDQSFLQLAVKLHELFILPRYGRVSCLCLGLYQRCQTIVFLHVCLAPASIFEVILDHADKDDEEKWWCVRWLPTCDRNRINHLQQRDYQVVNVGSLRHLVEEVEGDKVQAGVLGRLNPVG